MKTSEIADLVGGKLRGDADIEISSAAALSSALAGQIAFSDKAAELPKTNASCVIVRSDADLGGDGSAILIEAEDPKLAFARVAAALHPAPRQEPSVHPSAIVAGSATVAEGTQLAAGVRVGEDVSIGADCVIHANVVIERSCTIGDRVVLHAGVVIGADGFGYVRDGANGYVKFPQIGTVVIEDDVEIGANTCIDRGALGETRIGAGTKIDNLVQVGHNVNIGKRCVIAAQTGISGSVTIEDDCVIGGQVGFGDHVRVQSGAIIGSQAGILPGKIVRPGVWWGTPIQPLDEYKRQNAHIKGLARLKEELKTIKKKLSRAGESD